LDFADDIALLAGNRVDLQNLTDKLIFAILAAALE
jgi:hypothetical protein